LNVPFFLPFFLPFFFFLVNVLCQECERELEARDQADHPGCSWSFALVEKVRGRKGK
jgi:hypothetical protein